MKASRRGFLGFLLAAPVAGPLVGKSLLAVAEMPIAKKIAPRMAANTAEIIRSGRVVRAPIIDGGYGYTTASTVIVRVDMD